MGTTIVAHTEAFRVRNQTSTWTLYFETPGQALQAATGYQARNKRIALIEQRSGLEYVPAGDSISGLRDPRR